MLAANRPALQAAAIRLATARHESGARARVEFLEKTLERAFVIPGLNRPIGLDSILGLVPVAGDVVAGGMGLYLVWEARNLGLPKLTLARMLMNVGFDTMLGAIPLVGDAFDFFFRSNSRNLRLIKRHLDRADARAR